MRCRNIATAPETRYLLDPRQLFEAYRASDDFDRELVAVYHSHPRSPAYPSPTDRAEARWPDALYLLVSLRWGEPEVYAYRIDDGAVTEVPIVSG
jgi:proteasome lid subunit RPN8/RPN11